MKSDRKAAIAIEAFLLRDGHTGVERYILNLIRTLAQGGTVAVSVFVHPGCRMIPSISNPDLKIITVPIWGLLSRVIFQHFLFPWWVRGHLHVFFTGYLGSLLLPGRRTIISVFDLIALEHPDLVKPRTRFYYKMFLPFFLRRSRLIVAPSEKVCGDIRAYRSKGQILKLAIPVEEGFFRMRGKGNGETKPERAPILIVGYGEKKKGHDLLRIIAPRFPEKTFILVGKRIRKERFPDNIQILGFVPQEELIGLYRKAAVLLFLSEQEGYGLPIFEALVSGTPALCWAVPPFTETIWPLLIHPEKRDLDSLIQALEDVISRPIKRPSKLFAMIRWTEYWSLLEGKILENSNA